MKRWAMACLVGVWVVPGPVVGQRREPERALPAYLAPQVRAVFDDPQTLLYEGDTTIRSREVIEGDVAVLEGDLALAGEVRGDVVVVNGDLRLDPFARVSGDVIVLGGRMSGAEESVEGRVAVHEDRVRYERRGGRIRFEEGPRGYSDERGPPPRSRISVRVEGSYNRVEGLPVMVGPVLNTGGWNHARFDALAIWRSASGFDVDADNIGYFLRAEQHMGRRVQLIVGGTAHSMVTPMERWGITELESSLATALFHQDYRDYYDREGFSAFVGIAVPEQGFSSSVEYRHEDHSFAVVADPDGLPEERGPWTWRNKGHEWRPLPLVAVGEARSVVGDFRVDRRNDRRDATDGWLLHGRITRGVGGDLVVPEYRAAAPAPATVVQAARPVETDWLDGFLDVRRYFRVGPGSGLRLRGLLAGSLDGEPLPPQYQHTLGGVGSLPGLGLFSGDCGARASTYSVLLDVGAAAPVREPVFAAYGCDRIALFQAEFRGGFSFDVDFGDEQVGDWSWSAADFSPSWAVFFDGGRGWTRSEAGAPGFLGPDTGELMDVGVGLFLGDLGFYWAWPLKGEDGGANFFIRVNHRF